MRLRKNLVAPANLPVRLGGADPTRPRGRACPLPRHSAVQALHPGQPRWFLLAPRSRDGRSGLTLIELIVAFTILLILSTMALPLARVRVQREKERRLRDALTEMRKAIDRYKDYADAGKLGQIDPESYGYPESLEALVEGVEISDTGGAGPFGMQGAGGFGQPAGRDNRSGRSGFGSSRGGSGSGRGNAFVNPSAARGFATGGSGAGRGGFGQSGSSSSSSRGGIGSSQGPSGDEERKIRFLRRIPVDPITGAADWGMRSVEDPPESMSWGGRNVFDVFSKSMDMALDGTRYSEW